MEHLEQLLQCRPQCFAVAAVARVRQRRQKLHIPDQMGQTELHADVALLHVAAIGREVIAAENAVKLLAQRVHQHLGVTVGIDAIQGIQLGTETPGPPALLVATVSGLIHVEDIFVGQQQQQFLVRLRQRLANLAENIAQFSARNGHADDVTEKDADRRVGGMTNTFHEGDQGGQFLADQAAVSDVRRQRQLGPACGTADTSIREKCAVQWSTAVSRRPPAARCGQGQHCDARGRRSRDRLRERAPRSE